MPPETTTPDTSSPLLFWIHQLAQLSRRELLIRFKEQGLELTPEQWSLLVELWMKDGLSPSELAQRTGRDRPSSSRLIESLKKQGLIKRVYSEDDRRAYNVYLTAAGKQCHQTLLPIYADLLTTTVTGLTQEEQSLLARLLRKMYTNLNPRRD